MHHYGIKKTFIKKLKIGLNTKMKNILIIGGAGYVGCELQWTFAKIIM